MWSKALEEVLWLTGNSLSQSVWASVTTTTTTTITVTTKHELGGFKEQTYISHVSGGWEVQDLLAASFLACRQLLSSCILTWHRQTVRLIPSWGLHCHDLITSQRVHLQISSHWGLRFQHMNFGDTSIQFIASLDMTNFLKRQQIVLNCTLKSEFEEWICQMQKQRFSVTLSERIQKQFCVKAFL